MYYNKGCNLTRSPRAQKRLEAGLRQDLAKAVPVVTVTACDYRVRPSRTQRTECHGARKTERDKTLIASSVSYRPRSLSVALARSRSISLSPSPDKSEPEVVGIASNPYRVHQTEYIRRQYCIYFSTKWTKKSVSDNDSNLWLSRHSINLL